MSKEVAAVDSAVAKLHDAWQMVDDLWGGTTTMRDAGTAWLPKEPKESTKAYDTRLSRSYLYNKYKKAKENIAGKPFSKPVTLNEGDKLPEPLDGIYTDVDQTNRSFTEFAAEVLRYGIHYGVHFVLVDFPARASDEERTLEDDRRERVRPMFLHVTAPQLLGYQSEVVNGRRELTQVRIQSTVQVDAGDYGTKEVDQIRVMTATDWEVWQVIEADGDYVMVDSGAHSFGAVPLYTYYVNRTGYMQGQPALEDLAWLNISHWQSASDQRSILRFARVGILFASGLTEQEKKADLQVGANKVFKTSNPDAKMAYVEHGGKAIQSGERDLEKLEQQMDALGLQPFQQKSGSVTATARALDTSEADSLVQTWAHLLEDYLTDLYRASAQWMHTELPAEFNVDIQKDFALAMVGSDDVSELREMATDGLLSHETYLKEIKRRGVLHESLDVDEELDRVGNAEPIPLGDADPVDKIEEPEPTTVPIEAEE